jgi:hypothetical protein
MKLHMLWVTLALLSACTFGEGITVYGEMSSALTTAPPNAIDIVLVYSPEQEDHEAVGTTITGTFPTGFSIDVPAPRRAVVEESDGIDIASGMLWFARAGTRGTRSDGFEDGQLIQLAGYVMIYVVDDPTGRTPWGIADLQQGWNLIAMGPLTCADRVPLGGGAYGWSYHYDSIPLDSLISVKLYDMLAIKPWEPPFGCP